VTSIYTTQPSKMYSFFKLFPKFMFPSGSTSGFGEERYSLSTGKQPHQKLLDGGSVLSGASVHSLLSLRARHHPTTNLNHCHSQHSNAALASQCWAKLLFRCGAFPWLCLRRFYVVLITPVLGLLQLVTTA
jgi:hypothetical protein